MADNQQNYAIGNSKKKKNNYRPPQSKSFEQNGQQGRTANIINEFNSYKSSMEYSNYYFGFNIFDLYSPEQLAALVKDPMGNNEILREISLILYGTNGVYTNTVDYMVAMPTLDRVIVPHGKNVSKKKRNKQLM